MQDPDNLPATNKQELSTLTKQIRVAQQVISTSTRNALRVAIDAGDALVAAKNQVLEGFLRRLNVLLDPLLVVTTLELAGRMVMVAERAKGDAKRIGELEFALGNI